MVRNYAELVKHIRSQQRMTPLEWNRLIADALKDINREIESKSRGAESLNGPITFEEHRRLIQRVAESKGWGTIPST